MTKRKKNRALKGWQRENEAKRVGDFRLAWFEDPARWDLLLERHAIADDETALAVVMLPAKKDPRSRALRTFARANYTKRFIPEAVLELLGLNGGEGSMSWPALRRGRA